jgi:hypothetical protein
MLSILNIVLLTVIVIVLFLYFSSMIELNNFTNINMNTNNTLKTKEPINPKDELVNYFAVNWNKLSPILIKNDCYDEYVPQEILDEFNIKFGHYFRNKNEQIDPVLTHFSNGTYERNFKKEIQEICKILNSLSDFLNQKNQKNNLLELNQLGKEIERLHTEHFPQAVFIAVILDRMLQICKKYPNYNINQIADTKDLLTMSIILSLTSKTN